MAAAKPPRKHHYVPQFYLRTFATDSHRLTVQAVAKHGTRAIWGEKEIRGIGYQEDFYVHTASGFPVSVETHLNRTVETPIAESDTWAKISSGQTAALDTSDRAVLYALIRHLHVRTPHYDVTSQELVNLAKSNDGSMGFSDEELEMYADMDRFPEMRKAFLNTMAVIPIWTERDFRGAMITIGHASLPLRTSTTPVLTLSSPPHPAIRLESPGMTPFQLVLALSPNTFASMVMGDFDGAFSHVDATEDVVRGFNRFHILQFAKYDAVRHVITGREGLIEDMEWAPFSLEQDTKQKITFLRKAEESAGQPGA